LDWNSVWVPVLDQYLEFRMLLHQRIGDGCDALGIFDVEFNELNPRIRSCHLFQRTFAPSRDDDLVAFPMQRFSETAPDA
jgi:hypothetical protein